MRAAGQFHNDEMTMVADARAAPRGDKNLGCSKAYPRQSVKALGNVAGSDPRGVERLECAEKSKNQGT